jgi:DNA-binding NarL/FixJ family response regulator
VIRVVIADDQALVRGGFKVLVESDPECTVVGEAADGAEAIALARELRPDVVLMDIRMPNVDGIEAARVILEDDRLADTRILVLTTFDLDEYVFNALRIGASGFLLKDTEPAELLAAVKVVAAGEGLLAPSVTRKVIAEFANRPSGTDAAPLERLTDREREVLELVGRGLTNAELAETLFVSVATAKTHVSRIMTKLDARDRAQLVVSAYETGLVQPGSPGSPT